MAAKNTTLMADIPQIQNALASSDNWTLPATTNTTYTSTSSNNPYGLYFDEGRPLYGVERIMFGGLQAITDPADTPYDSAGLPGYYIIDGKTGLVRRNVKAYGSWSQISSVTGYGVTWTSNTVGDYLVVTGIFNKMNALLLGTTGQGVLSVYLNGTDTTVNVTPQTSSVLANQNYGANTIYPVGATFPSINLYTVKLVKDDSSYNSFYGIELITYDTSYPNNITIPAAQKVIEGKKITMPAFTGVSGLNYKGSTSNGGQLYAGTKGARVAWFPNELGYYVSKYTGVTESSQAATIAYNAGSNDTTGLTDSTPFYANSQGNIVRIKDATSTDRMLLVPTAATSNTLTFANDYDGVADATLFAGNKQFQDNGTTGVTFADSEAVTVELYGKCLANADHSNEECLPGMEYHWRQFGAGRSDDFSTLSTSASDRAFTLDDGITTLVGYQQQESGGSLVCSATTRYFIFTFIGTGLDITGPSYGAVDLYGTWIDGVKVGNVTSSGYQKICSDLPYGVHTVKLVRDAFAVNNYSLLTFRVYQPKTPTLTGYQPEFAYNVLADQVLTNLPTRDISDYNGFVDQGIIRKMMMREHVYTGSGSWAIESSNPSTPGLFLARINSSNDGQIALTYFGANKFRFWMIASQATDTFTTYIDGSAVGTNTPFGGTYKWFGRYDSNFNVGAIGTHTVQLRRGTTLSGLFMFGCFDVNTPIYEPSTWNTNPYLDYFISGTGVGDYRKSSLVTVNSKPREYKQVTTLSDGTVAPIAGLLLCVLILDKGRWKVQGESIIENNATNNTGYLKIAVDGVDISTRGPRYAVSPNYLDNIATITDYIILTKKSAVSFILSTNVASAFQIRVNAGSGGQNVNDAPRLMVTKISD